MIKFLYCSGGVRVYRADNVDVLNEFCELFANSRVLGQELFGKSGIYFMLV